MAQHKQGSQSIVDHAYSGNLSDQQLHGNNFRGRKYGKVEYEHFTDYQNFLYNRALFGLSVYSPEELKDMRWDKQKRIMKVHKRAQKVLNIWKQCIVNELSTYLFKTLFPSTPFTETLIKSTTEVDPKYVNRMSFKTLRITKVQIVNKLIKEGILPPDFYTLKEN